MLYVAVVAGVERYVEGDEEEMIVEILRWLLLVPFGVVTLELGVWMCVGVFLMGWKWCRRVKDEISAQKI